jgi:hypothetical protein
LSCKRTDEFGLVLEKGFFGKGGARSKERESRIEELKMGELGIKN